MSSIVPVLNKRDFVRRFNNMEFGNRMPSWNTFAEFSREATYKAGSLFHVRNRVTGGPTWYNVKRADVEKTYRNAIELTQADTFYFSQMAPTAKTLLQGEVMRTEKGLYLYCSFLPKTMREALATAAFEFRGLAAKEVMLQNMDAGSWDWINTLLDVYEDHVVEFSSYSVKCGVLHRKLIVWECRKY